MKKRLIIIIIVLLAVFSVSGTMAVKTISENRQGAAIYEDSESLAGTENLETLQPEDGQEAVIPEAITETFKEINLAELREKNEDVFGWIYIPGADISYPLLDGEDNEYYLTHTWDKKWNHMGSIFLEQECRADMSDFNTIIYGHNMKDTTMFSNLKKYMDGDFAESAPHIYIATEDGLRKYDIFAAYEVSVEGHAFWIKIEKENHKQSFIDEALKMSVINTSVVPQTTDNIVTLATCTGKGHEKRLVVQAVLTAKH